MPAGLERDAGQAWDAPAEPAVFCGSPSGSWEEPQAFFLRDGRNASAAGRRSSRAQSGDSTRTPSGAHPLRVGPIAQDANGSALIQGAHAPDARAVRSRPRGSGCNSSGHTAGDERVSRSCVAGQARFRGKTLWDWLQLLIVPAILIAVTFAWSATQTRNDNTREDRRIDADLQLRGGGAFGP